MGAIFKLSSLNQDKINKLLTPLVFCADEEKIVPFTKGYKAITINAILSANLIQYEPDKRSLFVTDEFNKIIEQAGESLLIKDFEILFNPEFQIDILKLFIMANRKKKIAVLWSGRYKNGKLIFAEPEYEDYKSYNIKDYDISCII